MKNAGLKNILILTLASVLGAYVLTFVSCQKQGGTGSTHFKCVTCANGGVCLNDTCRCNPGFEGVTCELQTRRKFIGSWSVTEIEGFDTAHYSIEIVQDANIMYVSINNLDNGVLLGQVRAFVSADTLTIPTQYFNEKMVVGKGYLMNRQTRVNIQTEIIMRYAVKDTTTGLVDDFGYYSATNGPSVWIAPTVL